MATWRYYLSPLEVHDGGNMKNSNVTRRDLINGTAKAGTAILALPYLWTRSSFADATNITLVILN